MSPNEFCPLILWSLLQVFGRLLTKDYHTNNRQEVESRVESGRHFKRSLSFFNFKSLSSQSKAKDGEMKMGLRCIHCAQSVRCVDWLIG